MGMMRGHDKADEAHADKADTQASGSQAHAEKSDGHALQTQAPIGAIYISADNHVMDEAPSCPGLGENQPVYRDAYWLYNGALVLHLESGDARARRGKPAASLPVLAQQMVF